MADYCQYCQSMGSFHKTSMCPGITEPKVYDTNKLNDAAVDFAKDLLMQDFAPLIAEMDAENMRGIWNFSPSAANKKSVFYRFVIALHAARGLAEEFRKAHIAEKRQDLRSEMDAQFRDRLREIDAMTPAGEPRGVS